MKSTICIINLASVAAIIAVLAINVRPVYSIAGVLKSAGKGGATTTIKMTGELEKIQDRLLQMCKNNKSAYCMKRLQMVRQRHSQEQRRMVMKRASMLMARNSRAIRNLRRFVRSEFS